MARVARLLGGLSSPRSLHVSDRELNATLTERHFLNAATFVCKVRYDTMPTPDFKPGQFTSLGFPKPDSTPERPRLLRRAYSIASSPHEKDAVEFFIVKVDEGALTPKVTDLPVGERLWMDPKIQGHFTLEPVPAGRTLVLVSTGTGLAPYVSMLRTYRGTDRWKKAVVLHGVRRADDLGYRAELEQLSREDPTVVYAPLVSREAGWGGREGRVSAMLEERVFQELAGCELCATDCHVFLCGNPDMIKEIQGSLTQRGFQEYSERKCPTGNIHLERYW